MYYRDFGILIQSRFSKLLFINKFYLFGVKQNLGSCVKTPGKFFLCKLDNYIAKSQKKRLQNDFNTSGG